MNLKRWLLDREPEWKRLETLLAQGGLTVYQLSPDQVRELSQLYRGLVNDLSRVRSSPDHRHLVPYLNNLAQRAHAKLYETPGLKWQHIARYFLVTFPSCFRRNGLYIGLATLAFVIGAVISMTTVALDPHASEFFLPPDTIALLRSGHIWTEASSAAPSESSFLMTNNIRVALMAFGSGLMLGLGTLVLLFNNGMFAFGGPLQTCFNYGVGHKLLLFMIPHGVIELTTIMIAGGAGMMMGFSLLFPGQSSRWDALRQRGQDAMILISGCVPLLIIAGIIEGMVSLNADVSDPVRIVISATTAVLLIVYLGFFGRQPKVVKATTALERPESGF